MSIQFPSNSAILLHTFSGPANLQSRADERHTGYRHKITFNDRASHAGALDRVPYDILLMIFDMLDPQSNFRLACTSRRAYTIVHSHRVFHELVWFAPSMLDEMADWGLIGSHSLKKFQQALRSDRCVGCNAFGSLLHLVDCRRCCKSCARLTPLFTMISPLQAEAWFALSEAQVDKLPRVKLPESFETMHRPRLPLPFWGEKPVEVIPVQAAKALGLEVHGSSAALEQAMLGICEEFDEAPEVGLWVQAGICKSEADFMTIPTAPYRFKWGLHQACYDFPYISHSSTVRNGLFCEGCDRLYDIYCGLGKVLLPKDKFSDILSAGHNVGRVLEFRKCRVWSDEEFVEHVRDCWGAQLKFEASLLKW